MSQDKRKCSEISLSVALQIYRESLNKNKTEMASYLGISREHYSNLESGKAKNPRLKVFYPLLRDMCEFIDARTCQGQHTHIARSTKR